MRAFQYAKAYTKGTSKYGDDYLEKRDFRIFLVALRQRFEYFVAFKKVDTGQDQRIDYSEFLAAKPQIEAWVGPISNPQAEFASIDTDGHGQILFDEFCEWSISKNLDLEDDDSEGMDDAVNEYNNNRNDQFKPHQQLKNDIGGQGFDVLQKKPTLGYGPGKSTESRVKPVQQSYDLPSEDAGFAGDNITDNYSNHQNIVSDRQSVGSYVNKFKENVQGAGAKFQQQADLDRLSVPEMTIVKDANSVEIVNFDMRSTDRDSQHIEPELQYAQDSFNYIYISLKLAMGFTDGQIQGFLKNQYAFFRQLCTIGHKDTRFEKINGWYQLIGDNLAPLLHLLQNEQQFDTYATYDILKCGLYSKNTEVTINTCQVFNKMVAFMKANMDQRPVQQMSGLFYHWLTERR